MSKLNPTVTLLWLAFALCWNLIFSPLAKADAQVGQPAPDISATTLSGVPFVLSDKRGKPVYIKFWATWCSYCKAEMPHLQRIYDKHGETIEVLTINIGINDSIQNVKSYFAEKNFTLPAIFDRQGEIISQYGIIGTPQHLLIDQDGNIIYRSFLITDELERLVSELVKGA